MGMAGSVTLVVAGLAPSLPESAATGVMDMRMGAPSPPVSTTVRAALYTGAFPLGTLVDHRRGRPDADLQAFIRAHSLFRGQPVRLAAAHRPDAFRTPPTPAMLAAEGAGLAIPTVGDLRRGDALAPDITGAGLRAHGHAAVPDLSPEAAANRLSTWAQAGERVVMELAPTTRLDTVERMLAALTTTGTDWLAILLPAEGSGSWPDLCPLAFVGGRLPTRVRAADLLNGWWAG